MGISWEFGVIYTHLSPLNINVNISFCHHKPTCMQTNMIFINGIFDFDVFVNCQLTMKHYNEISTLGYGHRKLSDAEENGITVELAGWRDES